MTTRGRNKRIASKWPRANVFGMTTEFDRHGHNSDTLKIVRAQSHDCKLISVSKSGRSRRGGCARRILGLRPPGPRTDPIGRCGDGGSGRPSRGPSYASSAAPRVFSRRPSVLAEPSHHAAARSPRRRPVAPAKAERASMTPEGPRPWTDPRGTPAPLRFAPATRQGLFPRSATRPPQGAPDRGGRSGRRGESGTRRPLRGIRRR